MTKVDPERNAAFRHRNDDEAHHVETAGAGVERRLHHPLVDSRQRIEDRHHHEDGQLVDIGDDDGEPGIEQHFQGLPDHAGAEQGRVDQTFLAEQRDPGNHPDDVRGPERDRAEQEQADCEQLVLDVEDQEIGDQEADDQREQPGQHREFQRRRIELKRLRRGEDFRVIRKRERRQQPAKSVGLKDARDQHDQRRQQEKRHQHQHQRRHVQPCTQILSPHHPKHHLA